MASGFASGSWKKFLTSSDFRNLKQIKPKKLPQTNLVSYWGQHSLGVVQPCWVNVTKRGLELVWSVLKVQHLAIIRLLIFREDVNMFICSFTIQTTYFPAVNRQDVCLSLTQSWHIESHKDWKTFISSSHLESTRNPTCLSSDCRGTGSVGGSRWGVELLAVSDDQSRCRHIWSSAVLWSHLSFPFNWSY